MQKLLIGYVAFSHTISLKLVCILQEQHISILTSPVLGAQQPDVVRDFHAVQGAALWTTASSEPSAGRCFYKCLVPSHICRCGPSCQKFCSCSTQAVVLVNSSFRTTSYSTASGKSFLGSSCRASYMFLPSSLLSSLPFFLPSSQGVGHG